MSKGDLTKREIATAFKKLMEEKNFDNITVTDITESCNLNRLTFYYHFDDKYALLNWIYFNDVILTFKNNLDSNSWTDSLKATLNVMRNDKAYYRNALAYDNYEFKNYMRDAVMNLFKDIINEWTDDKYINDTDSEFLARFFSHGIVGMIVDWVIKNDMSESPETLVEQLLNIVEDIKLMAISRYLKTAFEPE